jgi:hypothetical protein
MMIMFKRRAVASPSSACLSLLLVAVPAMLAMNQCVTLGTSWEYAAEVVSFTPGGQANADFGDPSDALGAPDMNVETLKGFVNLGVGGSIVLGFGAAVATDGPGPDLAIYGDAQNDERWKVEVSADGENWKSFGLVGEVATLDLAAVRLAAARYVRITDDAAGGTGVSPGGELDAVAIVNRAATTEAAVPAGAGRTTPAAASPLASRTWVRLGGPIGGLGYDIRVQPDDPRVMYVTDAWAGVHKSTDGGATWLPANAGIDARTGLSGDSIPVFCLTIDPNDPRILWAGTQNAGLVYRSTDAGASWERRVEGIAEREGLSIRGITVQQGDSNVVYAAGELSSWQWAGEERHGRAFDKTMGILYRSTDAGRHWKAIWRGDDLARYVWLDPRNPKVMYLSTGIFDREAANSDWDAKRPGGTGILKSVDSGATWKPANTGLGNLYVGSLFMHPARPDVLLAGAGNNTYPEGSGVYLTVDGGARWKLVQKCEYVITSVEFSTGDPRIAYAAGPNHFYVSADGGSTWTARLRSANRWGPRNINSGFPIDFQADPRNPQRLFTNDYGGGVFVTADGGRTWTSSSTGYTGADIRGLAVQPGNPAVVYANGRSGPYRSVDGGAHWDGVNAETVAAIVEGSQIAFDPAGSGRMIMSESNADRACWSDDGGATWRNSTNDWQALARGFEAKNGWYNTGIEALAFAAGRPGRVYAAFGNNACRVSVGSCEREIPLFCLARSDDGGRSWVHLASLPSNDLPAAAVAVHPAAADTILVAVPAAGVFRSSDAGRTFTAAMGFGKAGALSLAFDPADGSVVYAGTRANGVYKSVDGGASWKPSLVGMDPNEHVPAIVVDPRRPNVVYAGSTRSGLFVSTDAGKTWRLHNDGLRTRSILVLAVSSDGETLYAGTQGEGVFRLSTRSQEELDRLGASSGR